MARLILLLAIALAIYIVLMRIRGMPADKQRGAYIKLGLTLLVIIVIGLTATGRMHWVGAAFTALLVGMRQLLPVMLRVLPALGSWHASRSQAGNRESVVQTRILRMVLSHGTGALDGQVLEGEFTGRELNQLDREQLDKLMAFCREQDPDSVQLLSSYLVRRFGGDSSHGAQDSPLNTTAMSRAEALSILGLEEGAERKDIIAAHRRLMQKLHPDRGGSDYLAAKINQAKDLLLA